MGHSGSKGPGAGLIEELFHGDHLVGRDGGAVVDEVGRGPMPLCLLVDVVSG